MHMIYKDIVQNAHNTYILHRKGIVKTDMCVHFC